MYDATLIVGNSEPIEESILVLWLRDTGRKAAFGKALRAILATPGHEMMYDPPRGIYEDAKALPKRIPSTGDIWGGSILLNNRIDLVSMVSSFSENEISDGRCMNWLFDGNSFST